MQSSSAPERTMHVTLRLAEIQSERTNQPEADDLQGCSATRAALSSGDVDILHLLPVTLWVRMCRFLLLGGAYILQHEVCPAVDPGCLCQGAADSGSAMRQCTPTSQHFCSNCMSQNSHK